MIGLRGRDNRLEDFVGEGDGSPEECAKVPFLERQFLLVGQVLIAASAAHTEVGAERFGGG